jgi:type IV pilus assembly protein PilV
MILRIASMLFIKVLLSPQKRTAAGFTLVEILVAMTIFSIAVLGLAAGTVNVTRNNNTSHLSTGAVNIAQAKIEEFRAMTSAAFATVACPSYTSTGCSDTATSAGKAFSRSWKITANSPVAGVNQIDVKVDWTDYTSRSVTVSGSKVQ